MVPERGEALLLLDWAHGLNPGPWKAHSLNAARAAEKIAAAAGLDPERAFVFGALHDIGRYEGIRGAHHMVAGARLLREKGWDEAARICLTHSFPDGDIANYNGEWDLSEAEDEELHALLTAIQFDDYDRLIQLCDALALPSGICLVEKRLIAVALGHGVHAGLERKWRAFLEIREDFERRMGHSVYSLFPEAVSNTFGFGLKR